MRASRPYSDCTSQRKLRGLRSDLLRLCHVAFSAVTSSRFIGEQTVRQPSCRIPKRTKEKLPTSFPLVLSSPCPGQSQRKEMGLCLTSPSSSSSHSEPAIRSFPFILLPVFLPFHHTFSSRLMAVTQWWME